MEKKVRYLMLLLCLFLFPIRVFALEEIPVEEVEVNESSTVVAKLDTNEDNQENLEVIEDSQNVLQQDTQEAVVDTTEITSTGDSDELDSENPETDEGDTPSDEELGEVEDDSDEWTGEDENEEEEVRTGEGVNSFYIENAQIDLYDGDDFQFTATSKEPEKYVVVSEAWSDYPGYITNDETYVYEEYEKKLEKIEEGRTYDYRVTIQLQDGYVLENIEEQRGDSTYSYVNLQINDYKTEGNTYFCSNDGLCYFSLILEVEARSRETTYVDVNVDTSDNAYIGEAPSYNTTFDNEHFKVTGEYWYWVEFTYDENGEIRDYIFHVNSIDGSGLYDDEVYFDTFEAGTTYNHSIEIEVEKGYDVDFDPGQWIPKYHILVNGKEADYVYKYLDDESGNYRYILSVTVEAEEGPAKETTEEPVATTTTYTTTSNTSDEPVVERLDTTEKEDTKLEVKKDDKKETKEDKEEVEEESSNTGLIIFLVILVIIAVAIPVTIYRKKQ